MGRRNEATGKGCRRQCEGKRRHGRCRRGSMADVHSFELGIAEERRKYEGESIKSFTSI